MPDQLKQAFFIIRFIERWTFKTNFCKYRYYIQFCRSKYNIFCKLTLYSFFTHLYTLYMQFETVKVVRFQINKISWYITFCPDIFSRTIWLLILIEGHIWNNISLFNYISFKDINYSKFSLIKRKPIIQMNYSMQWKMLKKKSIFFIWTYKNW